MDEHDVTSNKQSNSNEKSVIRSSSNAKSVKPPSCAVTLVTVAEDELADDVSGTAGIAGALGTSAIGTAAAVGLFVSHAHIYIYIYLYIYIYI